MVASWACEVTEILTQRSSEEAVSVEYDTLKISFSRMHVHIV